PTRPGQGVQFTATVMSNTGGTIPGTPQGGTVQFQDEAGFLGAAVAVANGGATTPAISNLAGGTHPVTATYSGDADFNASTSTLAGGQVVNKAPTTLGVGSSPNPSTTGDPVDFTATVTVTAPASGTPTGQVQFFVDGSSFGSAAGLDGSGVARLAAITSLTVGTHPVTATYAGDATFNGGTSTALTQAVGQITGTTVASSANPSEFGQSVQFTATVAPIPPGAGTAGGAVQFVVDGSNLGTPVTLTAGVADSNAAGALGVGPHTVMANYLGDSSF